MTDEPDADFEYPDGPPCGVYGPPPDPDGLGYRCTRAEGHEGAHEVRLDGNRVDSWGTA